MISRIISFSARNKFLVIFLTLMALAYAFYTVQRMPLDALPDLSDTQVIIASKWDQSPEVLEDQVTYPIVSALLGAPKVKAIRATNEFGVSLVYVVFEDGTDLYWARSRVLEYLSKIIPELPKGVKTALGPDATSLGWVYQYALVDDSKALDLSQLRALQDWHIRYQLQSVPGVSEVASIGGYEKEYQVKINPRALWSYQIPLTKVLKAVSESNSEAGGGTIEFSGREFMILGRGYLKGIKDIEQISVGRDPKTGTPVLVKDIAAVSLGPARRRGIGELNGLGDAVSGIVIMRSGVNALNVIDRVKKKIKEISPSLPPGVRIIPVYDRSGLIHRAIGTLKETLFEEMLIVSLVILLFLWHPPSSIVPILTIPVSVFLAFIPMAALGITTNIMSPSGIAISIGILVDGAIVEVENAYKRLEEWQSSGKGGDFHEIRLKALMEVGPSVFFSLLVIAAAFLPIFALTGQEGRLFKPLAYSKTFAMAIAAVLAVTLDPAVRMLFTRMNEFQIKPRWLKSIADALFVGHYYPEEKHPISRRLFKIYSPAVNWVLENPRLTILASAGIFISTLPLLWRLGSEFMPPLNEGTILYMPTTLPGLSITEARRVLQIQDEILKSFPEVKTVYGKAGRAETATDPAPLSMMETTVVLKPREFWPATPCFGGIWKCRLSHKQLISQMDQKLKIPGFPNIWTQPIRNRIDMLSTGMRTPVGIKVFGSDLSVIQNIGTQIEGALDAIPETRHAVAERTAQGYYTDIILKRRALARYGLSVDDANSIIAAALGGARVTTTIEGRDRFPVSVRYAPDFRSSLRKIGEVLVPVSKDEQIPLAEIAEIRMRQGPDMIRDENGELSGYVYVDLKTSDIGGYVKKAKAAIAKSVSFPPGYRYEFSGQYKQMKKAEKRLLVVGPLALFLIVLLLYFNTGSWMEAAIVLTAVPFSAVGAIWLLWILGYHLSVAVWVGFIALLGLDAETGIFMLLYLNLERRARAAAGRLNTTGDLKEAIHDGAAKRLRPKMMTVSCAFLGLLPVLWSTGAGSDMMKRIAAPMVGGLFTSFILELLVYPAIYLLWHGRLAGENSRMTLPDANKDLN